MLSVIRDTAHEHAQFLQMPAVGFGVLMVLRVTCLMRASLLNLLDSDMRPFSQQGTCDRKPQVRIKPRFRSPLLSSSAHKPIISLPKSTFSESYDSLSRYQNLIPGQPMWRRLSFSQKSLSGTPCCLLLQTKKDNRAQTCCGGLEKRDCNTLRAERMVARVGFWYLPKAQYTITCSREERRSAKEGSLVSSSLWSVGRCAC
jgi:hypothetical protein